MWVCSLETMFWLKYFENRDVKYKYQLTSRAESPLRTLDSAASGGCWSGLPRWSPIKPKCCGIFSLVLVYLIIQRHIKQTEELHHRHLSPGRSLCRHPAGSAVWRTAASCHPRPSLARCGLARGWCSPLGARTLRGPPHSGRVEGNDLRFDRIKVFVKPVILNQISKNYSSYLLLRSPLVCEPSPSWPARHSHTGYWTSLWHSTRETGESLGKKIRRNNVHGLLVQPQNDSLKSG